MRNYTSLFPSYLRSKTPKVTWTLTNAVISSFSDGLTGLLLEDKLKICMLVEHVILLSTAFASIQEEKCMYVYSSKNL